MSKILVLLTSLILISSVNCTSNKEKVKIFIAWPGVSYLPGYNWEKGESKPTGVEPALIEKILDEAGYDYIYIPDYRITKDGDVRINALTEGAADIAIRSITISEERKDKVNFSKPYYYDGVSALTLKNSNIETEQDLMGKTVYSYDFHTAFNWANENLPESKIVSYNDYSYEHEPEELLLEGKIDAYLGDRTFLMILSKDNAKFRVLDNTFTSEPFGIAVRKDKPQLLKDINSAIEKLKKSGELEKITSGFQK